MSAVIAVVCIILVICVIVAVVILTKQKKLPAMTTQALTPAVDFTKAWTYSAQIQLLAPVTQQAKLAIYIAPAAPPAAWTPNSFEIYINTDNTVHIDVGWGFDVGSIATLSPFPAINNVSISCIPTGTAAQVNLSININGKISPPFSSGSTAPPISMPASVGAITLSQMANSSVGIANVKLV